jgi:glutamine amidotransferase
MITVVDYGMGNLRSVSKALESLGASVRVSGDPRDVERAEKLVVPGVGAFPAAMRELSARRLLDPVKAAIASGKPYLGICLGLQLLFESSEEGKPDGPGPGVAGLGVLRGVVKQFPLNRRLHPDDASPLKVPHIGWNEVVSAPGAVTGAQNGCALLRGIPDGSFFYFVHSYYAEPADRSVVALTADYGLPFTAMVWRENLYATQFHPEKSQAVGQHLLRNFVDL